MDDTIQSSASNAEESVVAAEEMSAQALQMREIADLAIGACLWFCIIRIRIHNQGG